MAPTSTPTFTPSSASNLAEVAFGYLTELVEDLGARESATEQEREAAEYLASQLDGLGYAVEVQAFTMESLSIEQSSVVVVSPDPEELQVIPLLRSATGRVSGELVAVGLARVDDMPEERLDGKVALAERGLITFEEKVNRAAEAGAAAVVVYNDRPGNFQGVLAGPGRIPVVAISQTDGRRIEELLSSGTVRVEIAVEIEVQRSQNVIAEKRGTGDGVVVLGAHYDTVPNIPGANDNASGTAVLLAIARELSQKSFPFTLRFIAFGSEELGLRGSRHYVDSLSAEERRRVLAMLNFDALGSGDGAGVLGSRELTGLAVELGAARGIDVTVSAGLEGAASDHNSFAGAGIPVIMFLSEDFSRIHTAGDTLQFVRPGLLGDAAGLAVAILESREFPAVLN